MEVNWINKREFSWKWMGKFERVFNGQGHFEKPFSNENWSGLVVCGNLMYHDDVDIIIDALNDGLELAAAKDISPKDDNKYCIEQEFDKKIFNAISDGIFSPRDIHVIGSSARCGVIISQRDDINIIGGDEVTINNIINHTFNRHIYYEKLIQFFGGSISNNYTKIYVNRLIDLYFPGFTKIL